MSRARRQLSRLGLALALCAAALGVGECALRRSVPENGLTPFRAGTLPGLASELRPGFVTHYRGFEASINAEGLRGPPVTPRRAGELRVALVGDSFTFGNGVAFGDTLGQALAAELGRLGREAVVFNCGVPGYNAEQIAISARERALALDVDLLVYVFFANDLEPAPARQEVPPDAVIDRLHGFPLHSALGQWVAVHAKRWLAGLGVDVIAGTRAAWATRVVHDAGRVVQALDDMRAAAGEHGARFTVAVYPFLAPPHANPFTQVDDFVLATCRERGIPCVALREAFPADDGLYGLWSSTWDSHPNAEGHRRAAALLAPLVLEVVEAP